MSTQTYTAFNDALDMKQQRIFHYRPFKTVRRYHTILDFSASWLLQSSLTLLPPEWHSALARHLTVLHRLPVMKTAGTEAKPPVTRYYSREC